jgi:hypothetical protein
MLWVCTPGQGVVQCIANIIIPEIVFLQRHYSKMQQCIIYYYYTMNLLFPETHTLLPYNEVEVSLSQLT